MTVRSEEPARSGWPRLAIEAALFFGAALALRLPHLGHPGVYDEFYHALAARSWLEAGSFNTEFFTYRRATFFSWLVALSKDFVGDDLTAARLPSLLAGCLLVVATWAFGRRIAGPWCGRVAALLLCLDADAVYFSQIARFYTVHALVLLAGGAILFFVLARESTLSPGQRIGALLGTAALFVLAFKLTLMSAIGIVSFLAWSMADSAPKLWRSWRESRRVRLGTSAAVIALGVLAALLLPNPVWVFGFYRSFATYAAERQSDFGFYLRYLGGHAPVLCALLPPAILLGIRSRPRFTFFALVVVSIGFVLHSGAGRKEERYLFWAIPLLYLLLGVGAAAARPHLLGLARGALAPVERFGLRGFTMRVLPALTVAAMTLIPLVFNPTFRMTAGMLMAPTNMWPGTYHRHQPAQWEAATPLIEELLETRCVLVSSAGVKALYHVGRLDYDLLRTLRDEHMPDHLEEFVIDHRTHRPTISEVASLEELQRRYASGVVVIDDVHWARPAFVPEDVALYLEERLERVPLPEDWRMRAFVWGEPQQGADPCATEGNAGH